MIISIDGPAGSGKSTVANELAKKLGFIHFVSGSLYRGITAYLLENEFDFSTIKEQEPVFNLNLTVKYKNNIQQVFVNNKDYTNSLRNNEVSTHAPLVSINKHIRKIVDDCQKQFCANNNVIIDGRDIGSFVFPNAEVKFYLDCDVKERAKRRFLEEVKKNKYITIEEIEKQIIERDNLDKTRKIAPLVVPKNAIIINSSSLTVEQVIEKMLNEIKKQSAI